MCLAAAKARAVLSGRYAATCDDVRWAALPVLRHRISTNFTADSEGVSSSQVVERLLAEVKESSEADYLARAPGARGADAPRCAARCARVDPSD